MSEVITHWGIVGLNTHIARGHEGAWGNCENKQCADIRYRLKYGAWPATPRHLTAQVDKEEMAGVHQ